MRSLGQRSERLALEVEEDPTAVGNGDDLTEVIVAVDALEPRPLGGFCSRDDGVDGRFVDPEFRHLGDRGAESSAHARRHLCPLVCCCGHRGQDVCQDRVHLGGCSPEAPRAVAEILALFDRVEGDTPRVSHARQEPLGEGEMSAVDGRSRRSVSPPDTRHVADGRRNQRAAGLGERGLDDDVRVLAVVKSTEHLADDGQRRLARFIDRVEDDRRVRLLAAEDVRPGERRMRRRRMPMAVRRGARRPLGLAAHPAIEHECEEGCAVVRIVRRVVDPERRRRPVDVALDRADEGRLHGLCSGRRTVGERNLVERGCRARAVAKQVGDEGGAIGCRRKDPLSDEHELCALCRALIPPLAGDPAGESVRTEIRTDYTSGHSLTLPRAHELAEGVAARRFRLVA
ncbi:hypothetical protein C5E11_04390 [Clavibacter michiganensis]|nr:hypothetical protein C5E11_04390 [Clavibacter michiganensis]